MDRCLTCRALCLLSGLACALACAQAPSDYTAVIREDWDWQARVGEVSTNPSGEIQGAPTWADAAGGVDGERTGSYGFHTTNSKNPWWQVDLSEPVRIGRIVVYNRNEKGLEQRASGMLILISKDGKAWQEVYRHAGEPFGGIRDGKPLNVDFGLANVRASGQAFPDVPIRGIRIVQILPKTTYAADQPRMSVARQISARILVGEVPVEEDGSAYFDAPAGVPVYFQALDENRMAVQTMRSITYLQPGEVRSCVGCHEPRQSAVSVQRLRAAVRDASVPAPGPEGTRPFSYIRLVQPVLDRHCIRCHRPEGKAAKLPLTGEFASQKAAFTRSYETLARKSLVPWFDSVNGGEWIPQSPPRQAWRPRKQAREHAAPWA